MTELEIFGVEFQIPPDANFVVVDQSGEVKYFEKMPTYQPSFGSWSVVQGGVSIDFGETLGFFNIHIDIVDYSTFLWTRNPVYQETSLKIDTYA